jgi:hypothetical protein
VVDAPWLADDRGFRAGCFGVRAGETSLWGPRVRIRLPPAKSRANSGTDVEAARFEPLPLRRNYEPPGKG